MPEHPILFTGWSVRAILNGSKTQTRRVPRPQPFEEGDYWRWHAGAALRRVGYQTGYVHCGIDSLLRAMVRAAPYRVGDVLWVRETWATRYCTAEDDGVQGDIPFFRADYEDDPSEVTWRSSMHMPKKFCRRLRLRITEVRAQRLQDISREDIRAEGIPETWGEAVALGLLTIKGANAPHMWDNSTAQEQWRLVWNALNAKRGWGWEKNRPVFAFTFEVVT